MADISLSSIIGGGGGGGTPTRTVSTAVSAAGTTQGGATTLPSDINVVTTVASNSGVILPTAVAAASVMIVNKGANAVLIYPATGASLDALGTNAGYSLPVDGMIEFTASATTKWYTTAVSATSGALVATQITVSGPIIGRSNSTTHNATYTFATADLNGVSEKTDATAYTWTIPNTIGVAGDSITVANSGTAGSITVSPGVSGTIIYKSGVSGAVSVAINSILTFYKTATTNVWVC